MCQGSDAAKAAIHLIDLSWINPPVSLEIRRALCVNDVVSMKIFENHIFFFDLLRRTINYRNLQISKTDVG